MQPLFNVLYVTTPNAYAHPGNATIRIDASRDLRGYTLDVNEDAILFAVILLGRHSIELA